MVRKKKIMSIVSNRRQNKLSISKFQILRFLLSLYNFNLLNCINFILNKDAQSSRSVQNIENAENKTTLMIIIIGFMLILGRLPLFYNYISDYINIRIRDREIKDLPWNVCIQIVIEGLFLIVISLNFVVYYAFNRTFRNTFKSLFCQYFGYQSADTDARTVNARNTIISKRLSNAKLTATDETCLKILPKEPESNT
jgi:hypothetical protein